MAQERATRTIHRSADLVTPLPVVIREEGSTETFRLSQGICTVGSGSKNALVLDNPTVSRSHAEFSLVPEGVLVRDLQSRNGTFFHGQRIESAILLPGTKVQLGSASLSIELDQNALRSIEPSAGTFFRGMYGASPIMLQLFTTLARLDGSLVPVLIGGESGAGKELVARAVHEGSRVGGGPFIAINCGGVSRELIMSVLFGHKRGAFTGAVEARKGAFVAADGGTLFLDEIGELPLDAQPALLRALETGEVIPVGEDAPKRVRVRVVAATHRHLKDFVREGKFREDLYYRLAVVTLDVPPLRERKEDIAMLARLFARQEGSAELEDDVIAELSSRAFPGNVRELRNAVLSYVALGALVAPTSQSRIEVDAATSTAFELRLDASYLAQRDAMVEAFTRRYAMALLEHTKGNQSEAARLAGLDRTYFGKLLARFGIARSK